MATGPTTPKGKKTVSRNAFKHGLRASKWLTTEEQADHSQLLKALLEEHAPQTATEHLMIERIAMSMTKLGRLQRIEDAMYAKAKWDLENSIVTPRSGRAPMALDAAMPPIKLLDPLARYQTSLERQISKSIGELLTLKNHRPSLTQAAGPDAMSDSQIDSAAPQAILAPIRAS
jgi:hypothetical protein